MPEENKGRTHLNRRQALRIGAAVGAAVAGIAAALRGPGSAPAQAQASPWKTMHLEVDRVVGTEVDILQAGSGPPQRGDFFHVDAAVYAAGDRGGTRIGTYQCFGPWTAASTDTAAPDQRFTTLQFHLDGRGAIMGLINEGGTHPAPLIGAVQGGTGEFTGALGTFQQGAAGSHDVFDLILPNVGP